jgi:hypothetical protein
MLRKVFGALVATFMLTAVVLPTTAAFAASPDPSFLNAGDVPAGSVLCLNITYKVMNDEDSGNVGYWALDNYTKQVQVWQVPDGSFYAIATYEGKWNTFAGALSPGAGTALTKDGSGTFFGGWVGTFNAESCPSPMVAGSLGGKDFGGTQADVLLGTYGAGQVGSPSPFDFLGTYFPGYTNFVQTKWGWTYRYQNQTWSNFYNGTSGDIVF